MKKPVEISAQGGVRNDLSPERFEIGDLTAGVNIELDETGKVYRRLGTTPTTVTNSVHSLWSDTVDTYAVVDGSLTHFTRLMEPTTLFPVAGSRVAYKRIYNDVFWSDGVESGILTGTENRPWGIAPPPQVIPETGLGDLPAGTYLCTMTYVRANGTESGAPLTSRVTVDGRQGLVFNNLPVSSDPLVSHKRLYLTLPDGELPYLVAVLQNSDTFETVYDLPQSMGIPLRTSLLSDAPAGQVIGFYNGRTFIAENNYLWYSRPYEYELFNRMDGYIGFTSPVRTFAAVTDGVFLGTETETVFLQGADAAEFRRITVADYGTVLGTEKYVPGYYVGKEGMTGLVPMWMSTHGVCVGHDGGSFKNLTGGKYILPEGVSAGASLLKVRGGTPQLVTSLFS